MAFCSDCDRDFPHDAALDQHYANSSRHVYCKPCQRLFKSWAARKQHWQTSYSHHYTYCERCDVDFEDREARWTHVKSDNVIHPNVCVQCRKQWANADALKNHYETVEEHRKTYCNKCHINFDSRDARFEHKKAHPEIHHLCVPCELEYDDPELLFDHFESDIHQHTYCTLCELNFENSSARLRHIQEWPEGHSFCQQCDLLWENRPALITHWSYSPKHVDTFCRICKQNFSSANNLREHSITHMPRAHKCWGCLRDFAPRSAMIVHLENGSCSAGWTIQHLNAIAENCTGFAQNLIGERLPWFRAGPPRKYSIDEDYVPSRGWVCYICDKEYTKDNSLTEHFQNSHSKDYPDVLSCPCCNTTFTKISGLLQHIETLKCSANYKTSSIAALMSDLQKEIPKPFYIPNYRDFQTLYQLQCDASRSSTLSVRVKDSDDEDLISYQMIPGGQLIPKGVKRKRTDSNLDDEAERRPPFLNSAYTLRGFSPSYF